MGFFSRKPKYPDLDSSSPAAEQVQEVEEPLKDLIQQVSDPIEVVTSKDHAYVFMGKPPKKFGVAMFEEGKVQGFMAMAKEKGLEQAVVLKINQKFRDAYEQNMDAERYTTSIAGKEIVVTPCTKLAEEVAQIVSNI